MFTRKLLKIDDKAALERVKSLVSNGDKLDSIVNVQSCLMCACYQGSYEIVAYLIQSGAKVNQRDMFGKTALHHCATFGKLECMKLLVANGAQLDVMQEGKTILRTASGCGRAAIVEYLFGELSSSRGDRIEALELLGVNCVDMKNDQVSGHRHWLRSLEERAKAEPGEPVQPKSQQIHAAYGNSREFQTVEELDKIASSVDGMLMQALIIRERIIGPHDHLTSYRITHWASAYYRKGDFDRCLSLSKHDLESHIKFHGSMGLERPLTRLKFLVNVFVDGIRDGFHVKCEDVLSALFTAFHLLQLEPSIYFHKSVKHTYILPEILDSVFVMIDILAKRRSVMSENEQLRFKELLINVVKLDLYEFCDTTLLHFACLRGTERRSWFNIAKLLLEAGADPNAVDWKRNTPLHVVARYNHQSYVERINLIRLLLSHGAHYDACAADGKQFTNCRRGETYIEFGNPFDYCTLQCLSAKAIVNNVIPYQSVLPPSVVKFVNLHTSK